ncbi:hypothetical protein T439DRAFT_320779 [Meredithblackwellia eburnea MCA 4105]
MGMGMDLGLDLGFGLGMEFPTFPPHSTLDGGGGGGGDLENVQQQQLQQQLQQKHQQQQQQRISLGPAGPTSATDTNLNLNANGTGNAGGGGPPSSLTDPAEMFEWLLNAPVGNGFWEDEGLDEFLASVAGSAGTAELFMGGAPGGGNGEVGW